MVHGAYKTNTLQDIHTFFSPFIMEEYQSNGVKEEGKENSLTSEKKELNCDEKYWEKYQNNVLPAIKQALKDDWLNVRFFAKLNNKFLHFQDIALVPGVGPPVQTSSFLLASLSPWLCHLLQSAGEDACVLLPSVSSQEVQPV